MGKSKHKVIGLTHHITNNKLIVKTTSSFNPRVNRRIATRGKNNQVKAIGKIKDVIGPKSKPYLVIKPYQSYDFKKNEAIYLFRKNRKRKKRR